MLMVPAEHPIVFDAPYSVYVRAVRLALEEKGVRYELVPARLGSLRDHAQADKG
jgi:glutathione S-transferase